jgi:hypothetical protein
MTLDRLLGTWNVTMHHTAMPEPAAGRQTYERVLEGAFVQMTSTYDHPDLPDARAILSEETMHYFDVRKVIRVFDLRFDADSWSMVVLAPDFSQRSTTRFVGDDAMQTQGDYSGDLGETWRHDFTVDSVRVERAG